MHPVQILLSVISFLSVKHVIDAGKLEQDVVKTAQVAFRGSQAPAIVCSSQEDRCNGILRAVQNAGIVTSHWSLKGFRHNLNLLKREILLRYDAIVFIIRSLEYFATVIQKLILVHSQARYVIVEIGEENQNNASEVDCCRRSGLDLFEEFWREKRMHRVIMLRFGCPGFAFTANIFVKNETNCMRQISTDDANQLYAVFTRRIKNMNGQILRISMSPAQDLRPIQSVDGTGIPYEGLDATILREYVKYLNFTVEVTRAPADKPYAFTFPNGTMVGSAIDLTTGKSDIVFNGNFMYYLGSTPAQISTWYKEDALCVVIKKAGRVPKLIALFTPFSLDFVWAALTMVCLVGFILYGVRLVVRSVDREQVHWFDSVATVLSHMTESPMSHKKSTNTERLLLASCSLWAIVVLGTYQGCLRGSITIPKDLKDIDTLKELDEGGYQIYVISENLKTVFQSPGSQLGERLVERTVLVHDKLVYKNQRDRAARLTRKESSYRRVQPDEHVIPECVRRSQLSFFMRVGSPASRALNRMLSSFCEGGIIQFMEVSEGRAKAAQDQRLNAITTEPGQFTLVDVQGAFVILAVGSLISTIVFGFELLNERSRPRTIIHLKIG